MRGGVVSVNVSLQSTQQGFSVPMLSPLQKNKTSPHAQNTYRHCEGSPRTLAGTLSDDIVPQLQTVAACAVSEEEGQQLSTVSLSEKSLSPRLLI